MITLSSFIHREALRDLLARWLINDFHPDDPWRIKELVNYNSILTRRLRSRFATLLADALGQPLAVVPVWTKGQFKDLLILSPCATGCADPLRVADLIAAYQARPELYYRETPFEGVALRGGDGQALLAAGRIKRVRRIAEKVSRRITDAVFALVKGEAQAMAERRAAAQGIPIGQLWTPPEHREAEFVEAEQRVLAEIRRGHLGSVASPLVINDVLGFKLLGDQAFLERFLAWVERRDDLELIEREAHSGAYRATNLILRWTWPRAELAGEPLAGADVGVLAERGLEGDLTNGLRGFVDGGEPRVDLEVIVQDYGEALESEIGRSMHEERVIRQRDAHGYRGGVARNITVLTQFFFYYALSRRTELSGIPIQLWVRYMPDVYEQVLYSLTDFPAGAMGLVP